MLSLTTLSLSLFSAAISSRTGATILHGPHHSAQKSTRTGLSLCRTSTVKSASVVVLVAVPMRCSSGRGGAGTGLDGGRGGAVPAGDLRAVRRLGRDGVVEADVRLRRGVLEHRQVALGVERRGAAGARCRDGLAVGVVDQVAGGED